MKPSPYLAIPLWLAITACSPEISAPGKQGVIVPKVQAAVTTAPVAEAVARVSQSVDVIASRATSTADALDQAVKAADDARALSTENTAMRSALDQVVSCLAASRTSNGDLVKELSTLKNERTQLQTETATLTQSVSLKETEVTGLRQAVTQANQDLAANAKTIKQLNTANTSLIKSSATSGVYRAWVIGGVVILILAVCITAALKFYRFPIP